MTKDELKKFVKDNQGELEDTDTQYVVHSMPWPYFEGGNAVGIDKNKLKEMSEEDVKRYFGQFKVEQITRVTGYMTKVSGWNKGKKGELKDRVRFNLA